MVLFVHNRYRTTGGEERAVADLMWLVREQLGEPAQLLQRDSAGLGRPRATIGLLAGGLDPGEVYDAVRAGGARIVHAHNLQPALGWRALAAAREAGARVVLHLHQYRLVCAVGVAFTRGSQCTRCHGRDTLAGVRLNCRGSVPEALAYGASLALWQRRLVAQADAVIVPSRFARERLRELGAPLPWERVHVLAPALRAPAGQPGSAAAHDPSAEPAAAAHDSPDAPAADACRIAGLPLVVAGDGPQHAALARRARGDDVRFLGAVDAATLARLRAGAAIALAPSRSPETFGLALAEAMAAGLPAAASAVGAFPDLLDADALVPAGDAPALAAAIARLAGDRSAGERNRQRIRALCDPAAAALRLARVYDAAIARGGVAGDRAKGDPAGGDPAGGDGAGGDGGDAPVRTT
jgi:glycosyltransferase involved in cell wall biosynthesis